MNENDEIIQLLREIQRMQQREAESARNRWRAVIAIFVFSAIVAMPAVLSYAQELLVNWL